MKESEIILHLLFPTNQETARAIDPGMGAFHDPAPGTIPRDELFLAFLFPPTADVRLVVPCHQFLVHRSRVVGSIQTHMLWLLRRGLGSADHQTIEGGTQQTDIMAIGSIYDHSQRDPGPIGQETALGATFAAIGRVGSGRGAIDQGLWS
jgi:hypothetical protein